MVLDFEITGDMKRDFYWLSFADGSLPEGSQFLGACIVRAISDLDAVCVAHRLGINPGGEVQIMGPLDVSAKMEALIYSGYFERLMSKEVCAEMEEKL